MVTRGREVKIYFSGDPSSAVRAMRNIDDQMDRTHRNTSGFSTKMGRTFKNLGRGIATGIAGGVAAATVAVTGFTAFALREASEAQKVTAQTRAVIKSTGGAAKVTAGQIADLAEAMSLKSGIDDEAIQSAGNLLLTFTNVRNEAGKGRDIFNQTMEAALDMSTALGTDARDAAMLLGKALNDPETGMSRLTRAGVTFNDKQKETIKRLQETGDVAGAQRIIIQELNKEFGGSAAAAGDTYAGTLDRLRVQFGNIAENIGNRLMPHMQRFADWVQEHMPEIEAWIRDAFQKASKWIREDFIPALQDMKKWWDRNGDDVIATAQDIATGIGTIVGAIKGTVEAISDAWDWLKGFWRDGAISWANWAVNVTTSLANAFGGLPRIGGKLRDSQRAARRWRDALVIYFEDVEDKAAAATRGIEGYADALRNLGPAPSVTPPDLPRGVTNGPTTPGDPRRPRDTSPRGPRPVPRGVGRGDVSPLVTSKSTAYNLNGVTIVADNPERMAAELERRAALSNMVNTG